MFGIIFDVMLQGWIGFKAARVKSSKNKDMKVLMENPFGLYAEYFD